MCNYTVYCNFCTAMHETTSAVTRGKKTETSYSSGQRYQDTHPEGQAPHILFAESANSELYGFLIFACASLETSALLDCYVHAFQEHKMGYILWRRPDACFEDFWRLSRHFLSLFWQFLKAKAKEALPSAEDAETPVLKAEIADVRRHFGCEQHKIAEIHR